MIEVTYDGKPLQVRELKLEIDKVLVDEDMPPLANPAVVDQELTLNIYYYQLMWLARMVQPQNPKKAKHIRKLAESHNPLRLIGLK